MDFGYIPESMLAEVDFGLPADPSINALVLDGKRVASPQLFLGTTRWTQADWVGNLYPARAKPADFLRYYSEQFNCIELNATHYKIYDAETLSKWGAMVAGTPEFQFCAKLYQGISHRGTLKGKEAMTREFVAGLKGLMGPRGAAVPVFIQLSENFGPARQVELLEYLSALPGVGQGLEAARAEPAAAGGNLALVNSRMRWLVELRHPDWFNKPSVTGHVFSAFNKLGIGAVITDVAGRRDVCHMQLPAKHTMIRFVGNQLHATDYQRLEAWAQRLANWFDAGLEQAYFILHMGDDAVVPAFAVEAARILSSATGIHLPTPVLHESGPSQGSLF